MSLNTTDTINIEITLTDDLRRLLNSQETIKRESQFNCTQVKFADYENKIMPNTTITKEIFKLIFEQHPCFQRNKHRLYVSTFRTCPITDFGLNGEVSFHRDNILFPDDCDRNLIITWCAGTTRCGTEALNIADTEIYNKIKEKFAHDEYGFTVDENYNILTLSPDDLLYCNEDILNIDKYVKDRNLKVYKSSSPNPHGNITALIMSGKSVLHRREKVSDDAIGQYRYVLNIYYNSRDF